MCLHTHADSATGRITRHGPAAHATRAPRRRTTMIAGTLVVAISCWSLFAAAAQHGSDRRLVHYDGDLVRNYRTSAFTDGEPSCCAGRQFLSTEDDDNVNPFEVNESSYAGLYWYYNVLSFLFYTDCVLSLDNQKVIIIPLIKRGGIVNYRNLLYKLCRP